VSESVVIPIPGLTLGQTVRVDFGRAGKFGPRMCADVDYDCLATPEGKTPTRFFRNSVASAGGSCGL